MRDYLLVGLIYYNVLIDITQLKLEKLNVSDLLDRSSCILVPVKEQKDNQYGSSGTDHLRSLSETVQDRGNLS